VPVTAMMIKAKRLGLDHADDDTSLAPGSLPHTVLGAVNVEIYKASTCALAQGVFLRNFKLDFTEGSFLKQ
jgi:hypothetical protein